MTTVYFITHPDVEFLPAVPVPRWPLSARGRRRMQAALDLPWAGEIEQVFSSAEQKAVDGATILREGLDLDHTVVGALGENDRSATGFLEPEAFWSVVEAFFAEPERSVRGWERACDAQPRIVAAVERCLADAAGRQCIAVVAHGGVGCLLLCHLKGEPISRANEQPGPPPGSPPGSGGGCYFVFDGERGTLLQGWQPVDT